MDKNTEKQLMDAELVLLVIDGKVVIKKNRNLMTRSQLIKLLDSLTN